jgi:predicted porin
MKKSLFAIAAVTAFAGAAQAQSSVTVYGILDVGFRGQNTTVNNVKTSSTQFSGTGSQTTSRLGFRGTEDLGGGTSAFFTVGYTGGKNNNNGWGLGLNYTFKKFTGTAAYQSLKAVDPYTATPANAALGTANSAALGAPAVYSAGNGTAGVNVQDNQAYVGATYDFGILKAYAGWIDTELAYATHSNLTLA